MIIQWVHSALAADEARARREQDKPESKRSGGFSANQVEKEIVIANRLGLHARPAARFVQVANRFRSEVWVAKDGTELNGKSILGLIILGANQGSKLRVRIEGPDAYEAMREIERLIESWLDEDRL